MASATDRTSVASSSRTLFGDKDPKEKYYDSPDPETFRRPNPTFHERPSSVSSLSLYEFSSPKPAKEAPLPSALGALDIPIIVFTLLSTGCLVAWAALGGFELPRRADIPRSFFNRTAFSLCVIVLVLGLAVAAPAVERLHFRVKQTRKVVREGRASWSKRWILLASMLLALAAAGLWGIATVGPLVVHLNYAPWEHREARTGGLAGWVGGDRAWKKDEKLGAKLFTAEGGVLQVTTLLALGGFLCLLVQLALQVVQFVRAKPKKYKAPLDIEGDDEVGTLGLHRFTPAPTLQDR